MTSFEQKAQALFERFAKTLAAIDISRAVNLPAAIATALTIGTVAFPAHVHAALHASQPAIFSPPTAHDASVNSLQAQSAVLWLNANTLAAMNDDTQLRWSQAFAMQRATQYWHNAQSATVQASDPAARRVANVMHQLVPADGETGPRFEVAVADTADMKQAVGLEGNRIVIPKSLVASLSDSALAFTLSREIARVLDGTTVQRYSQLLGAASDAARANPDALVTQTVTSFSDLDRGYAKAISRQTTEAELSLDSEAAQMTVLAGYDGIEGGKEAFSRGAIQDSVGLPPVLRGAALEAGLDPLNQPSQRPAAGM